MTGQSQNAPPVGSKDTPPRIARNYIAGRFLDAGTPFPNLSPVDGSLVGEVLAADAGMVDAAVSAAQAAVDAAAAKIKSGELVVHDYMSDNTCPAATF